MPFPHWPASPLYRPSRRARGSLLLGLAGYWDLAESGTGTRYDALGQNNLTDTNGATQAAGVGGAGKATAFASASSQYLTHADAAALRPPASNASFCLAGWVYLTDKAADYSLWTKRTSAFFLYYAKTDNQFQWGVTNTALSANQTVNATTFGSPSTATWYFLYTYYDHPNQVVGISVNNGTTDTGAATGGTYSSADASAPFQLGKDQTTNYLNGRMAYVGKWNRLLTAPERTALYNSGFGRSFAQLGQAI